MARPRGSKNKPKTEDQPSGNGIGHNGAHKLTDGESRALTLHHKRLYEAAEALVEKAKADRKAVADLAKADLGKGALADIKDLIAAGDEKKIKAKLDRELRIARWSGIPIGFQVDMFADRRPAEEKWAEEGSTAGMAGEVCQPPAHLSPSAVQVWIEHWHAGQAILASAFGKKRAEPSPPPDDGFAEKSAKLAEKGQKLADEMYGDAPFHSPDAPADA